MQRIGIQIDRPFIRIALLQKQKNRLEICLLKSALFTEMGHVKQLYSPKFKGSVVSGLPTKEVFIRSVELKITDNRHLKEALNFHYEATSHFNPAEMLSISHCLKKHNGEIEALLFTTPKEALKSHLLELEKMGVSPDRVSTHSMALVQYLQWKAPSLENAFLVDLGFHEWTCVLMEKGRLKKAYALSQGMEALFSSLWEDRKKILLPKEIEGAAKQIDLLQLKSHFNPHLSSKLNEMKQELTKIIFSFHRIANQQPLIFTGNIDGFGHLSEFLTENFKEAIVNQHNFSLPIEEQKYAIPIGLALEQGSDSLQFLQQEFFPKKNWHRTGFYSLVLGTSSLLLTLIILLIGLGGIQSRKSKMVRSLETTLDQWDPELKQIVFSENADEETILSRWISTVTKYNKEYPYILQAPKVHEVLLWLSHHPFLNEIRQEGDSIDIQEVHYQLLEYPNINAPQENYQAKVELEFKVQNPINARKFHELLLKGDALVDASAGIHWEMLNDDGYRTSFFLKNRIPHVP
jgi:hypothetical protein